MQLLLPHQSAFACKHFGDQKTGKVPEPVSLTTELKSIHQDFHLGFLLGQNSHKRPKRGLSKRAPSPSNLPIATETDPCPSVLGAVCNDKVIKGKEVTIKCNKKQTSNPTTKGHSLRSSMTRVSIHWDYLEESSHADGKSVTLQYSTEGNPLNQLLPGWGNTPSNTVFSLAQSVSHPSPMTFSLFCSLKIFPTYF